MSAAPGIARRRVNPKATNPAPATADVQRSAADMDHSVTMGAEIADRLVRGTPELCWKDKILPKTEQTLHLTPDAPRPGASRRVSVPA